MLAKLLLGAVITAICAQAHAAVDCSGLFQKPFNKDSYYILVFLGGIPVDITAQERNRRAEKRQLLESRVSPKLQDYVYKLAENLQLKPPDLVFLTCDSPITATDLSRDEAGSLSSRNVIAVLWSGTEGGKASVIQLSIPHYQRRPVVPRRQVEVAWLHSASTAATIDDWIIELDKDTVAQQTFVALGIGFMSIQRSQLQLAKRSLCQARSNLKLMAPTTIRPDPVSLERDILSLVTDAINEVELKAKNMGIDLNADERIKRTCNP